MVTRAPFGRMPDGRPVDVFTLTNGHGLEMRAISYGAIIVSLHARDRSGHLDDVVLGHDDLAGYLGASPYFGAVVGRYANRIAHGRLPLDGQTHQLAINDPPNHLHGGVRGFDKVIWDAEEDASSTAASVTFRYASRAGEESYPGTLRVAVTYTLTDRDELRVDYSGRTDGTTVVNLTQHSYFNLAGGGRGDVLGHVLTIDADHYLPIDATAIPTGVVAPVAGTPFDFRAPAAIGLRIDAADEQLAHGAGYDHCYVVRRSGPGGLVMAARLDEPVSGRRMEVRTTEPGLQFYSGNRLDGRVRGKSGRPYPPRAGLSLETQHYPDSPNHPEFPSPVLHPGQEYRSTTVFTFGVC
ncbi:MAG TPA: aldose epimerase family protein [Vicinamibacteria bacterium]|nr:aldose epimerase family protein [Vicinamibacteria bacterium]